MIRLIKESIRVRFALIFIGILVFSCVSSFALVSYFAYAIVEDKVEMKLTGITDSVRELQENTDLSHQQIKGIIDTGAYEVNFYNKEELSNIKLTSEEKELINAGKSVFILGYDSKHVFASVAMVDNLYTVVTENLENNDASFFKLTVSFAFTLCAIVGSILMFFAIRMITGPIKRLTAATQEVAKGNFEVNVDYGSKDEIGVLTKNFNVMTKELRNMEYLRKDFINNVSHEFKTPIASIQGFTKLLKNADLSREHFDDYTDIIIEESQRLTNLSSNILKLSQLENQIIPSKEESFSLDEQIRKTILLFESQWIEKELELDIDLPRVNYIGDQELIKQIWINLINNAIKFSIKGGKIRISLEKLNDTITVIIEDEGIGISSENKERIFEKFYQEDSSHSSAGNGLGLAIVKRVVELNKGTISLESEKGRGSRFKIELPIKD